MIRTQIYLDDTTYRYLKDESTLRHATISELIRESVREQASRKMQKLINSSDEAFGVWKSHQEDVDAYIREKREDRKLW